MPERALARSVQSVVDFEQQDADGLAELICQRFSPVRIEPVRAADRISMSGTYGQVTGIDFSRAKVLGEFGVFLRQPHDGVFFIFPTIAALFSIKAARLLRAYPQSP